MASGYAGLPKECATTFQSDSDSDSDIDFDWVIATSGFFF